MPLTGIKAYLYQLSWRIPMINSSAQVPTATISTASPRRDTQYWPTWFWGDFLTDWLVRVQDAQAGVFDALDANGNPNITAVPPRAVPHPVHFVPCGSLVEGFGVGFCSSQAGSVSGWLSQGTRPLPLHGNARWQPDRACGRRSRAEL